MMKSCKAKTKEELNCADAITNGNVSNPEVSYPSVVSKIGLWVSVTVFSDWATFKNVKCSTSTARII